MIEINGLCDGDACVSGLTVVASAGIHLAASALA